MNRYLRDYGIKSSADDLAKSLADFAVRIAPA
jgi:hypothetical protein